MIQAAYISTYENIVAEIAQVQMFGDNNVINIGWCTKLLLAYIL